MGGGPDIYARQLYLVERRAQPALQRCESHVLRWENTSKVKCLRVCATWSAVSNRATEAVFVLDKILCLDNVEYT